MSNATVIDNKRIVKNTFFLYGRMLLMMLINLYTVRLLLQGLGVDDFGIYNVVGSVVAFSSFITGSLTAASNRFFAREFVKNDKLSFNNSFCLNVTVFGVLMVGVVFILETIGLCYVNEKMTIPEERMLAANIIYQFTIFSLVLSFLQIPYNALVIIYEKMSVFAYIGIIEALLRLGIAVAIVVSTCDRLIEYGALTLVVSAFSTLIYYVYCRRHFPESRYRWYWNKEEFKEVGSFSGLYFLGSMSFLIKSQGLNLLINAFFNPAINAARAIAVQVEGAIMKFSDGYFTASKPQLYKAYANEEYDGLNRLLMRTTVIGALAASVFSFPVMLNTNLLLSTWLTTVPNKAEIFLQLIILDALINMISNPVILGILATGKQALYQSLEFLLRFLTLPFSYIMLANGTEPEMTVTVCIVFSLLALIMRALILKRQFPQFDMLQYFSIIGKMLFFSLLFYFGLALCGGGLMNPWLYFVITSLLTLTILPGTYYLLVMTPTDRKIINNAVINKLKTYRRNI